MHSDLLAPHAFLSPLVVGDAVRRALAEDLGRAGDITSMATIPEAATARAKLAARKRGVLAGLACAQEAFAVLDPETVFQAHRRDGDPLQPGDVAAEISGNARAILSAERTALNFTTHLSGVAPLTAAFVAKVKHTKARIVCTRKTIPGLRALEKYAVRCGGGMNHRFGLDDAILIKDNHIAVAGGAVAAIERARAQAGHMVRLEVEVDSLEMLADALTAAPDAILLDNMSPATLREAVGMVGGRAITEASGGITLATVTAVAESGVDYISSGWITHSAPSLDLGLDVTTRI
jgi:nicotinate-nucleotide pyrophosphorylase (carboxylating)